MGAKEDVGIESQSATRTINPPQLTATVERLNSIRSGNAVWDRRSGQAGAITERPIPYAGDTARDGDACEIGAIPERIIPYAGDDVLGSANPRSRLPVAHARDLVDLLCRKGRMLRMWSEASPRILINRGQRTYRLRYFDGCCPLVGILCHSEGHTEGEIGVR